MGIDSEGLMLHISLVFRGEITLFYVEHHLEKKRFRVFAIIQISLLQPERLFINMMLICTQ